MKLLRILGAIGLAGSATQIVGVEASGQPGSAEFAIASAEIGEPSLRKDGGASAGADLAPAISEPAKTGNPLWAIPISKLSATRDRPLFSASRRPPPPTIATAAAPPPSVEPAAPDLPPFTLVGTIIGDADRIGIFLNETSKSTIKIRQGDADSGWTLRTIDPYSAVFEGYGRMVTLLFPKPSEEPPGALPGIAGILSITKMRHGPAQTDDGL
jgi:general secretion pathway protein N